MKCGSARCGSALLPAPPPPPALSHLALSHFPSHAHPPNHRRRPAPPQPLRDRLRPARHEREGDRQGVQRGVGRRDRQDRLARRLEGRQRRPALRPAARCQEQRRLRLGEHRAHQRPRLRRLDRRVQAAQGRLPRRRPDRVDYGGVPPRRLGRDRRAVPGRGRRRLRAQLLLPPRPAGAKDGRGHGPGPRPARRGLRLGRVGREDPRVGEDDAEHHAHRGPEPRGAAGGLPRHQRDQHDPQRDRREPRHPPPRADRRGLHHARRLLVQGRQADRPAHGDGGRHAHRARSSPAARSAASAASRPAATRPSSSCSAATRSRCAPA